MLKKAIAFLLVCAVLFSGCAKPISSVEAGDHNIVTKPGVDQIASPGTVSEGVSTVNKKDDEPKTIPDISDEFSQFKAEDSIPEFSDFGDQDFLQYIEDNVYAELAYEFASEDYIIENVEAAYISQEYLEEIAYNSRSNIFFGYTLEEIAAIYQGSPFVFTLGANGETIIAPYEEYDDPYDEIIRNVAIGTGVILFCVTVSVATAGTALAPVSIVFATAAKTATSFALYSGTLGGLSKAMIVGIQTGDLSEAAKAGALAASEGFKWGAISGAVLGAAGETINQIGTASRLANNPGGETIRSWRASEQYVQSQYGGTEQLSFLDGEFVPRGTPGSTRPDVVRLLPDGTMEAIEVKNYNLANQSNVSELISVLEQEVSARVANLPAGSLQRIVLDVEGRGFSSEMVSTVCKIIQVRLGPIYPNIPIDIIGALL